MNAPRERLDGVAALAEQAVARHAETAQEITERTRGKGYPADWLGERIEVPGLRGVDESRLVRLDYERYGVVFDRTLRLCRISASGLPAAGEKIAAVRLEQPLLADVAEGAAASARLRGMFHPDPRLGDADQVTGRWYDAVGDVLARRTPFDQGHMTARSQVAFGGDAGRRGRQRVRLVRLRERRAADRAVERARPVAPRRGVHRAPARRRRPHRPLHRPAAAPRRPGGRPRRRRAGSRADPARVLEDRARRPGGGVDGACGVRLPARRRRGRHARRRLGPRGACPAAGGPARRGRRAAAAAGGALVEPARGRAPRRARARPARRRSRSRVPGRGRSAPSPT